MTSSLSSKVSLLIIFCYEILHARRWPFTYWSYYLIKGLSCCPKLAIQNYLLRFVGMEIDNAFPCWFFFFFWFFSKPGFIGFLQAFVIFFVQTRSESIAFGNKNNDDRQDLRAFQDDFSIWISFVENHGPSHSLSKDDLRPKTKSEESKIELDELDTKYSRSVILPDNNFSKFSWVNSPQNGRNFSFEFKSTSNIFDDYCFCVE